MRKLLSSAKTWKNILFFPSVCKNDGLCLNDFVLFDESNDNIIKPSEYSTVFGTDFDLKEFLGEVTKTQVFEKSDGQRYGKFCRDVDCIADGHEENFTEFENISDKILSLSCDTSCFARMYGFQPYVCYMSEAPIGFQNYKGISASEMNDFLKDTNLSETLYLRQCLGEYSTMDDKLKLRAILNRLVELVPSEFSHFERGWFVVREFNPEEGLEDFEKCLEINPEFVFALEQRGESRFQIGDFEGAIDDATTLLEMFEEGKIEEYILNTAYLILAYSEQFQGNSDEALEYLSLLVNIQEGEIEPLFLRADFFLSVVGDEKLAKQDLKKIYEIGKENEDVTQSSLFYRTLSILQNLHMNSEEYEENIEISKTLIPLIKKEIKMLDEEETSPELEEAKLFLALGLSSCYQNIGVSHGFLRDFENALENLTIAVDLSPKNYDVHEFLINMMNNYKFRSHCYNNLEDSENAQKDADEYEILAEKFYSEMNEEDIQS